MENEDIVEYEDDDDFEDIEDEGDSSLLKLKEGARKKKGRGLDDSAAGAGEKRTADDYDELDDDDAATHVSLSGPGMNSL